MALPRKLPPVQRSSNFTEPAASWLKGSLLGEGVERGGGDSPRVGSTGGRSSGVGARTRNASSAVHLSPKPPDILDRLPGRLLRRDGLSCAVPAVSIPSAVRGPFEGLEIDLLHLHHRPHRPVRSFRVGIAEQLGQA